LNEITTAASILVAGLGVAKPIVESGCKLIENLLGEPCKVSGNMIADEIYFWQWKNRIKILNQAQKMLDDNSVSAKVIPKGFLLPLLDKCGNVEDPDLQEMWAVLLTSGVKSKKHQHPSYINILSELSPIDAQIAKIAYRRITHYESSTSYHSVCEVDFISKNVNIETHDVVACCEQLVRLGLLGGAVGWGHMGRVDNLDVDSKFYLPSFGNRFFSACIG